VTDRSVVHQTFVVERRYAAAPDTVFAAWADPVAKAQWFAGPEGDHELDFRVGGLERNRGRSPAGAELEFESLYREIVPVERIVYTSVLTVDTVLATASLTSVQFGARASETRLVLTESGAFLDGLEPPALRQEGTGGWLDRLTAYLSGPAA
jgi:uncharacterized protein YndB with AHSA1/START domain